MSLRDPVSQTTPDEPSGPPLQAVLLRMIREAEEKIEELQIRIGALREALRAVESVR